MKTYHRDGRLIQEQLDNEWELLVAAILLNQSRRTDAWDSTLATLLERWPDPASLAASDDFLEETLRPHGFCNVKARRLRRMSEEYPSWDGEDPRRLYGIGTYGYDSWRIFVRGDRPSPEEINDGPLSSFVSIPSWESRRISLPRCDTIGR